MAPIRIPGPSEGEKLRKFYSAFGTTKFKKGEIIFLSTTEPEYAYAVRQGIVRSFSYTNSGEDRSISFVLPDELFPMYWIHYKTTDALFNYIAHTDCELYKIDRSKFHEFLSSEPDLAQLLLSHSMSDNVTKMLGIEALKQETAEHKVLFTFNNFALSYGKHTLQNLILIKIPLTQKDIASFTGLTRETVTVIIGKLKKQGIISVRRYHYTVDVTKLRDKLEIEAEAPTLN